MVAFSKKYFNIINIDFDHFMAHTKLNSSILTAISCVFSELQIFNKYFCYI